MKSDIQRELERRNPPPKAERRPTGDYIPLVEILRVTASGGIWL